MIKNNIKQAYGENTTCDFKEAVERKQPKSWLKSTDVFTQFGYMEKRGSGLRKIRNETAKLPGFTNEKRPTFRSQYESFFTEILNNNYSDKSLGEVQNDTHGGILNVAVELSERQKLIILAIQNVAQNVAQKNKVNTQYLAETLGVNRKTIQRELADLVEKHIVQWVGSDKTGHWEVTCPPNVPQNVPQDGSINGSINDIDVAVNEADVVKSKTQNVSIFGNVNVSEDVSVNDGDVIKDVVKNVAVKSKKQ